MPFARDGGPSVCRRTEDMSEHSQHSIGVTPLSSITVDQIRLCAYISTRVLYPANAHYTCDVTMPQNTGEDHLKQTRPESGDSSFRICGLNCITVPRGTIPILSTCRT